MTEPIFIQFPLRIISEANNTDHWAKKYKRKKQQKLLVKTKLALKKTPQLPCLVKITRIAPRKLDYDNLCFSQKAILDTICDYLNPGLAPGRADSDKRITVEYYQEKGKKNEYAIRIEILPVSFILNPLYHL